MAEPAAPRSVTELDVQLRELFADNVTWKILDCVEQSYGFVDGGCWDVATALREWLGVGDLMVIAGRDTPVEHVVLRVGAHYLDADGVADEVRLLRRWRTRERVAGARLAPFEPQAVARSGVPRHPGVHNGVRNALTAGIDAAASRAVLGA